jgi:Asp-tRNA(Asn)/Glu-tRNA(Gln) amidotransferase A subunit family amidase
VLTGDSRLADPGNFADLPAPRIGMCHTPEWALADDDTRQAWALAEKALGQQATLMALPASLAGLVEVQKEIQSFETARSLSHERLHHAARLSAPLGALIASGLAVSGERHASNLKRTAASRILAAGLFTSHDVLLAPSSIGEAPAGLDGTGDPVFCRTWTLLGLPCIHLPFLQGKNGLPVGLQLVGAYGDDHRLMAAAHWVHERLKTASGN